MGGHLLNGKAQAGGPAAKALGPDAQAVDGGEQFLFQLCVVGVGVGYIQRAQQGLFGQIRHLIKGKIMYNTIVTDY